MHIWRGQRLMLAVLLNHSPPYFLRQNRSPNLVLTNMVSSQCWPTEPPVPTSSAELYQGVPWEYIAETAKFTAGNFCFYCRGLRPCYIVHANNIAHPFIDGGGGEDQ